MRSLGAGGAVALCLGLAVAVAPAAPPEAKEQKGTTTTSWWSGLFGGKPKEEPKPAADKGKTVADRAAEETMLRRAYMRRLAVCDRLRLIARDTDNARLESEADRLEQIAWKLYTDQSSKLLGVAAVGVTPDDLETAEQPGEKGTAPVLRKNAPGGPLPPRLRSSMQSTTPTRED